MKKLIYISLLFLIGCGDSIEIDESLVFDDSSWWLVNFDSLATIENYVLTTRKLRKDNEKRIKPFIITDNGKKISLRELRPPTGIGYFWDRRALLKIYVDRDYTNVYYLTPDSMKRFDNKNDLQKEVKGFYYKVSKIDFQDQDTIWGGVRQNKPEIFIKPMNDTLYDFNEVIENVAIGFQRYKNESCDTSIELQISIMSNKRIPYRRKNRP